MASLEIEVKFCPLEAKAYNDNIVITSDAVSSPDIITVTGLGYESDIYFNFRQRVKDRILQQYKEVN